MVIILETPYKELYRKGYVRINPDGRKVVDLFNSNEDRTTITYARYVLCVDQGCLLPDGYEVDHKDEDKTNDAVSNLQLLTEKENVLKYIEHYRNNVQKTFDCKCADSSCNKLFVLTEREVKMKHAQGNKTFYCSKSCYLRNAKPPCFQKDATTIAAINNFRKEGRSQLSVARELGISPNTVRKYW